MPRQKQPFRPVSRAIALEPRLLFDGAAAVATADHFDAAPADVPPEPQATEARALTDPISSGGKTLFVIDTRIGDYQALLSKLPGDIQVRQIDGEQSGLALIGEELARGGSFDAVHIVSHGSAGRFTLGTDAIDAERLNASATEIAQWRQHLSSDADILLYGCEIAGDASGQGLIQQLATLTGADIAASTTPTGSAARGGDWTLEAGTGPIEARVFAMPDYQALLADSAINDSVAPALRVTPEDTQLLLSGLSITDADAPASMSLRLVSTGGTSTLDTGGTTLTGSLGSSDFTISGSLNQINTALATLRFTPGDNQNSLISGFDPKITLTATDVTNTGNSVSRTINFQVSASNDAPTLSTQTPLTVAEGSASALGLSQLASSANALDPDIATGQQVLEQQMMAITSLPSLGSLSYKGGAVATGQIIPVSDLANLSYTHNGNDIGSNTSDSFGITVNDGGGGETAGTILITLTPKNVAPTISGSPSLIEGQVKAVAPGIALGDAADTWSNATVRITALDTAGQGTLFFDVDDDGTMEAGEVISAGRVFTADEASTLSTRLKFAHNGSEPNAPGATRPSYTIEVQDSGGGETGASNTTTSATITIDVVANNDDPTLANTHATPGTALAVGERSGGTGAVVLTPSMLAISDADRNPANTSTTTPTHQLVYTIGTPPAQGELHLQIGGLAGYDGDGWITLGAGGRFTQADIDAGKVRYYQTTNISSDTADTFTLTVRDSAFGYADPNASPLTLQEGAVRDSAGNIQLQTFHLQLSPFPTDGTHTVYEGPPRPPTPGYGLPTTDGGTLTYAFVPTDPTPGNKDVTTWTEVQGAGNPITKGMLEYVITRTYSKDSTTTVITVPATETVYTLTSQPGNGTLQRNVGTSESPVWESILTNGQFTQDDINTNRIRFVSDGSENHTATFGYRVSDGTANNQSGTFAIDVTPTNDRPTASGGVAQVTEGNGNAIRLGTGSIGMSDVDESQDAGKRTGEGAKDFLWFKITALPAKGMLQRWDGDSWEAVDTTAWLPGTLLTASADGATSGLRYVHDGSEPLAYAGGPKVTFDFVVRDDLAVPGSSFDTSTAAVPDTSGTVQSNQSAAATATINIIPVNNPPQVASTPESADPDITPIGTITNGGVLTGRNDILQNVPEGGTATITSSLLTAVDPDNTTTQRQYRITTTPALGTLLLDGKALGIGSTFTQADIDGNKLAYRHNGTEVGALTEGKYHDKFHFVVSDAAATTGDSQFWITLVPSNDKASVNAPTTLDVLVASGTPVPVPGITVDDPDLASIMAGAEEDFLRVEVQVLDSGNTPVVGAQLTYSASDPAASARSYTAGTGTNTLFIQGTKAQVQAVLDTLSVAFTNDEDSSSHKIRVTVDDRLYTSSGTLESGGGNPGANGGITATTNTDGTAISPINNRVSRDITLIASNTNDLPTIVNGNSYTVNEDASVTLNGFTLSDVDSFDKAVTVTVQLFNDSTRNTLANATTEGKLSYAGLSNVTASGANSNTVTLTGTLANVQTALNQIRFQGATDYNGSGTGTSTLYLRTTFTDFGHPDVAASHSVMTDNTITITPVNDAPVLTVPGTQSMSSGTYIDITSGFNVQDTRDTSQGANDYIEVKLEALEGVNPYGILSIQTPGTATVDNNGTGTLTVKGSSADVRNALNTLRYTPTDANVDKVITIRATADDRNGSIGNGTEGIGVDGNNTDVETFSINISGTNDSPVVTVPGPVSVVEDSTHNAITGVSYTDGDDFGGVQRFTLTVGHGTLDLGTKTGLTVVGGNYTTATVTIEGTKAALNTALATLRYTPTANYHGGDTLTVEANDKGLIGTGGARTDTKTLAITVTPVNDRPTASTNVTLASISEDSTPAGTDFSTLDFGYSDATDNQTANAGGTTATGNTHFAIVGTAATTAQGRWQVSTNAGSSWITVPTSGLSVTNALVFSTSSLVRFLPAADFNGTPGNLNVRLSDGSLALATSNNSGDTKNLNDTVNGDADLATGAWNSVTRSIGINVTAVNDAPTQTGTNPLVTAHEDETSPAGQTVLALFGSNLSDTRDTVSGGSSAHTLAGIAITGMSNDKGVWEYNTGSSWSPVPADVADTKALVLDASALLRFRPTAADYNGTPTDSLSVRLIDTSAGAAPSASRPDLSGPGSGGSTPYSDASNTVTLSATVTPRNDAPTLTVGGATSGIAITVSESGGVTGTGTAFEVALLTSVAAGDTDLASTAGLNANLFGAGSITVTLTDPVTGDLLTANPALPGIGSVTAYNPATGQLVIQLTQTTTVAQVQTILESVKYAHKSDDPTQIRSGTPDTQRSFNIVLSDGNNDQGGGRNAGGPTPLTTTVSGTITITPENDPPTATDDTHSISEDAVTPITGNVKTGIGGTLDTDPDNHNAQLSISGIRTGAESDATPPAASTVAPGSTSALNGTQVTGTYGVLTLGADGSYSYALRTDDATVAAINALKFGETLTDRFTYTLTDGTLSDQATLSITLNGTADGGTAILPVDGNGAGAAGQATVHERGLNDSTNVTETATGNISISATDGLREVVIGTTTVSLASLNGLGAAPITITTTKGVLTLTGYTSSGSVGGVSTGGTLSYSYTLSGAQDHSGGAVTDTIGLKAVDAGNGESTGTLTVLIVDDQPTAEDDETSLIKGAGTATATGNVFASGSTGDVADRLGADHLATPVTGVGFGGTPGTLGNGLAGAYGTLTLQASGAYTYALDSTHPSVIALTGNQTLTEVFRYTITDKDGSTSTADLTITIIGNTPPLARPDTRTSPEDTLVVGNVIRSGGNGDITDTDADNDPLSVTRISVEGQDYLLPADGTSIQVSIPGKGVLRFDKSGSYTFSPVSDWHGSVPPVLYTISDGQGGSASSTLNITVTPVSDIVDNTTTTRVNTPVITPVLGNDSFEGTPTVIGVTQGGHGTVTLNQDGTVTYTPAPGFTGIDRYTYTVSSGGTTETATVTVTVANQPPRPLDDTPVTPEDTPLSGNVLTDGRDGHQADGDPDGDPLTLTRFEIAGTPYAPGSTVVIPGVGQLTLNADGRYTFVPVPDWNGSVPPITYTMNDGTGAANSTATATLNITVTPVSDIVDNTTTMRVNTPVTTPVLDNDSFEGTPTVIGVTQGGHGTVTLNQDGTVTYTPAPGFTGIDRYTYTVSSGGTTETATVTVTVANQPPRPLDDTPVTPEDTPLSGNVLTDGRDGHQADGDPDGDPLTLTRFEIAGTPYAPGSTVVIPGVGQLTLNADGRYTFVPVPDWNGSVPPVTYTVDDGTGAASSAATATLNITVTPLTDIVDDRATTIEALPVTVKVSENDHFEGRPVITGITQGGHGTVTATPDGALVYTPAPGFVGTDTFTYTVTSGGVTETATVTIDVSPPPSPPTPPAPSSPAGEPRPSPLDGPTGAQSKQPLLLSPVITDPSIYFAGERFDEVRRLPLPFHPIVYVNRQVQASQQDREHHDARAIADPAQMEYGETRLVTLDAGQGMDPNLFVTHAIRDSHQHTRVLSRMVDARYGRVELGSDGYLPRPSLFHDYALELPDWLKTRQRVAAEPPAPTETAQQDGPETTETAPPPNETDAAAPAAAPETPEPPPRVAPSFSEQLRKNAHRLPLTARAL